MGALRLCVDGLFFEVSEEAAASSAVLQRYLSGQGNHATRDLPLSVDSTALRMWLAGPDSSATLREVFAAAQVSHCSLVLASVPIMRMHLDD